VKLHLLSFLLLSAAVLTLSGCIADLTYSPGPSNNSYIFLDASPALAPSSPSNTPGISASYEILGYPLNSTGTPNPAITLAAPSGTVLVGAGVDNSGNVYALTTSSSTPTGQISVYSPTSSTPSTPVRTITLPAIFFGPSNVVASSIPAQFAVDPSGNVFVNFDDRAGTLVRYAPGAADNGTTPATPALTLTRITQPQEMTTDSAGDLYDVQDVYDADTQTDYDVINVYRAGFTTTTPARTINPTTIVGTNNAFFGGIAVDGSGNVYTTLEIDPDDTPEIAIFSTTANVAPTTTITGSNTTLTENASGIALDSAGNIYVRDDASAQRSASGSGHALQPLAAISNPTVVDTFAANATGNAAPTNTFNTGISDAFFNDSIAIH
jgi:hypothetical protein